MQELKRLRKERDWSQQRLADESGVDRATINQVEGGRRSPTIETLEKLALAMGAEVADFFPKAQAQLPLEYAVGLGPNAGDYVAALGLDPDADITEVPLPTREVKAAHEAALVRLLRAEQGGRYDPGLSRYVLELAAAVAALPEDADKAALRRCAEAMMERSVVVLKAEMARIVGGTTAAA